MVPTVTDLPCYPNRWIAAARGRSACCGTSPPTSRGRLSKGLPEDRGRRVLQDAGDVGQEHRAELPVDQPVVEGQRKLGDLADRELTLVHPRHRADLAEG